MKVMSEVSPEKLRGGYYTPQPLVQFCFERLLTLLPDSRELRVLEPSAGDGAFFRGIAENSEIAGRIDSIQGIEPQEIEAEKSKAVLSRITTDSSVLSTSAIDWAIETNDQFDAAVGNPPFVRYQFISADERRSILELGLRSGLTFPGVSNLWIPVLVAGLSRLKDGGAFSFVVPSELLTGSSASVLRAWLTSSFENLRIDLFRPGSFPEVLQEVVVISGTKLATKASASTITISEGETLTSHARSWTHAIDPGESNWTRYLLSTSQLAALRIALDMPQVKRLGDIVRFQVSAVTGANDFFTVTDAERERFDLDLWALPLLPRVRNSPGLVHTRMDQSALTMAGSKAWLLDFSESRPNPLDFPGASRYIDVGEASDLHDRYKCRIRKPWYRVPHIRKGDLMLSKRSHRIPKVVVNRAASYATDTIYRGDVLPGADITAETVSTCFHSSLTMLTVELEGRSFGGGVLELVPSEVSRLSVAVFPNMNRLLEKLDDQVRNNGEEALVSSTDDAMVTDGSFDPAVIEAIQEARHELMSRRLARNARPLAPDVSELSLDRAA